MLTVIRDIWAPDPGALQLIAIINQGHPRSDAPLGGRRV